MTNKKFISLICVLAMVFSMFSAFTVVNAADEKGIGLAGTLSKDGTEITMDATAVQTEGVIKAFTVKFNVPDGVTKDDVQFTAQTGVDLTVNVVNGVAAASFASSTGVEFTGNKLFTAVIKLSTPLTTPLEIKLQNDSSIKDTAGEIFCPDDMTAASAVVTPAGNEFTGKTTPLKNYVGKDGSKDAATVAKEAEDAGKTLYLTVDVKKADGTSAVYGTDFVANYGGKQLTAKEFNNLIHGYTDEKISDVINGLTFVYNSDVKTISTTLNAVGDETQLVQPVEDKTVGGSTPSTPKPSKPSIGVTVKPTTVYVGDSVTVTAKITNPKDGGVLTVAATDESLDYVAASGIKTTVADDNKSATTTFKAADKGTNAVVLNYTYTYTDAEGVEQTVTFEKKITIKEKTTDNGGSGSGSGTSSSSGGTGPIANGSNTTVTNPYGPSMFKDLGDAPWASEAITMLASKNIVSGRDENTFDPNANITRAEYCQILVGAIGKSAEYADASFDDVPTDAWFYHAVAVASKYGIVSGYGDGNFGPYDLITRQDMALMTQRAAEAVGKNLTAVSDSSFTDADQISEYAQDAVYTLANAGIINGMGDGTFAPKANATRAQASVIIYTTFVK